MAVLPDGREIPDHYDDVGVLAPGGGTRGITEAGQTELLHQHSANLSLPTRLLGTALGAAETIVPAAGSPKQTLRQMAKAARDWIVQGPIEAFEAGTNLEARVRAGDPRAAGQALAAAAGAAVGTRGLMEAAAPTPVRAPMDFTPAPTPEPDVLATPTFTRRGPAPTTTVYPTNQAAGLAALARRRRAEKE